MARWPLLREERLLSDSGFDPGVRLVDRLSRGRSESLAGRARRGTTFARCDWLEGPPGRPTQTAVALEPSRINQLRNLCCEPACGGLSRADDSGYCACGSSDDLAWTRSLSCGRANRLLTRAKKRENPEDSNSAPVN